MKIAPSPNKASRTGNLTAVSAALLKPPLALSSLLVCTVFAALTAAIGWASQAEVMEVAIGDGQVIPSGKVQIVQNLEGGIVKRLLVKEGATVRAGDLLLQIDPTGASATLGEIRRQIVGLEARMIWLTALLNGEAPAFPDAMKTAEPLLVSTSLAEHGARLAENEAQLLTLREQVKQKSFEYDEAKAQIESISASLDVARKQLAMVESLGHRGAAPKGEVLSAKAKVLDFDGQLSRLKITLPRLQSAISELEAREVEIGQRFRLETAGSLIEAQTKLQAFIEASHADEDRVKRSDVLSPTDGVVKAVHANTIGQVLKPGEDIVELVPTDNELVIQTKVRPADVAFLTPGQKAVIKLSAYDYSVYGALQGEVLRVGADSTVDDRGNIFFLVDIRSERPFLERNGQKLPILPGMLAQVDIVTGSKTVLSYLTKPMHRMATGALRER